MIIDIRKLNSNTEIRGNIAIIGAGAAGITLAIELAKYFKDVLLLESGGLEFEQETQNLYDGRVVGQLPADFLKSWRMRYFGGTTNVWTGLCAQMDAVDFERIPNQPNSGWPFKLDQIVPFYERAYPYFEIGKYQEPPPVLSRAESKAHQILNNPDFELTEFRYSPPTRFGERYRFDLASSDRIKVYLHANVTDILVSNNGEAVSSLDVQTFDGRKIKVTASAFILCCGGIENPRILLNCTRFFPAGIGNQHDLVGRFFMENPAIPIGNIIPQDKNFDLGPMFESLDGSVRVTVAFKTTEETAARPGRRAGSIFLFPVYEETALIEKARSSSSFEAIRGMLQDVKHGKIPANFAEKTCIALEDLTSVSDAIYYRLTESFRHNGPLTSVYARLEVAQIPNPDSRVKLIDEVDALGTKRAALDWRITDEDIYNINQTAMAFARGVGAAGFGRMIMATEDEVIRKQIIPTGHHIGTTRMHNDKRQGVVDQNCQVYGLDNFFIAGSSVFPTGIRANPTLTIVALAIRLADHLRTELINI